MRNILFNSCNSPHPTPATAKSAQEVPSRQPHSQAAQLAIHPGPHLLTHPKAEAGKAQGSEGGTGQRSCASRYSCCCCRCRGCAVAAGLSSRRCGCRASRVNWGQLGRCLCSPTRRRREGAASGACSCAIAALHAKALERDHAARAVEQLERGCKAAEPILEQQGPRRRVGEWVLGQVARIRLALRLCGVSEERAGPHSGSQRVGRHGC